LVHVAVSKRRIEGSNHGCIEATQGFIFTVLIVPIIVQIGERARIALACWLFRAAEATMGLVLRLHLDRTTERADLIKLRSFSKSLRHLAIFLAFGRIEKARHERR
jgi:hypothetical protein